ncbi:DUF2975 domain-containing protein [Clostridium botulinum]|uniref:Membrane protein n=1 Tax=Clostridium botulinum (strain Hall / ATCC 3502 / NCTC 13319 / Type A) TaxID=441771 RepID=A5HZ14_CLOBH|nr:DUF2975 domain-containing protein [Clostridium botulinum]EPS50509.1 hypothetical protein CFSAN002369_06976 [Clostridium botulinum CFSAN002369]EPS51140.1 hypothetical protein CFSAN002367_08610 [Clostridium botulinum CFSAN002367]ABS32636.1 conserved hypothetical protein [Clostridium botulinum A str. ATCC 19397]ABS37458.1 conserved hypothetical protein [Clostridium botulinum A str. Hall]AWB16394.1 DUF2975 domain-containing protein [Clostridium botulinum]
MKEGFSIKFIKVLLMILIFGCTCMLGKYGFMTLFAPEKIPDGFPNIILFLFTTGVYIVVAWNLLKIVFSIDSTPFSLKNVKNFKIIGYLMLFLSLIDAIESIVNFKKSDDLVALGIILDKGIVGIRPSCILYLVLGIMALVLAEIFKKAVKIKNENDLTI